MHEVFSALDAGAVLVTAGHRLARVLTEQYDNRQRGEGRTLWKSPDILPLDGFLRRAWEQWLLNGDQRRGWSLTLLNNSQEQAVWEQVIRESPAGESLLRVPETARQAMEAWRLAHAYRLPIDGRFESSEDTAAFAAWTSAFVGKRDANEWLEPARLADAIAGALRRAEIAQPGQVLLAGFDEHTPQQSELFAALGTCRILPSAEHAGSIKYLQFRDNTAEISAAAAWARALVEEHPNRTPQVGIIIPGLEKSRVKVDRIFRETLAPGREFSDSDVAHHVSLGPSLPEYPMLAAALLALEFASGSLPLPQAGRLLRSPFLGGADAEWSRRAQLDARLRRYGIWEISVEVLLDHGANCPMLQRMLARFSKLAPKRTELRSASAWSQVCSDLLSALEWPGDRVLSSGEIQVRASWQDLLTDFAALELTLSPLTFAEGLARLRELAAASSFQVENQGAPIQIMGLFEASGLEFDHLWIMGLHDDALPAAVNPNPFLPVALQREHQLPHSSAELELIYARRLLDRLLAGSRNTVLSYPAAEGDRALSPSPLIKAARWSKGAETCTHSHWIRKMRNSAPIDELLDEVAPPVVVDSTQPGGSSLFKDMAACPFRAFAKHRLGARELEKADIGVNARDQGNTAHKALAALWNELGSQAHLLQLTHDELTELIAKCVDVAVQGLAGGIGRKAERLRLERLLAQWLAVERSRDPFVVACTEETREVTLGGLNVRTRADRLDRLRDGREIILDYKTGKVGSNPWEGDRPAEPQIPLYCATSSEPIAAAAFVVLHTGEPALRGMADPGISLPALKKIRGDGRVAFSEQIDEWRVVLEALASRYRAGDAAVDPKPDACEFCRLRALCRIREYENDRG